MTAEQVKWRYDKVGKLYKEEVDHDNKSGNDTFVLAAKVLKKDPLPRNIFDLMAQTKGHRCSRDPAAEVTHRRESAILPSSEQPLASASELSSGDGPDREEPSTPSTPVMPRVHSSSNRKNVRKTHGSGKKVAAANLELSQQFNEHLDKSNALSDLQRTYLGDALKVKRDRIGLYERDLLRKELKDARMTEYLREKEIEKQKRFIDKMKVENAKLLQEKERNKTLTDLLLLFRSMQVKS